MSVYISYNVSVIGIVGSIFFYEDNLLIISGLLFLLLYGEIIQERSPHVEIYKIMSLEFTVIFDLFIKKKIHCKEHIRFIASNLSFNNQLICCRVHML